MGKQKKPKKRMCPRCRGVGENLKGRICPMCQGVGKIEQNAGDVIQKLIKGCGK